MVASVLDLFSGAGGMSGGFARSGKFQIVGAVDIEKGKPSSGVGATNCNATYKKNIGVEPINADLSEVLPSDISTHFGVKKGELDVLISCAPCTGFSQKNSRNHIVDDGRNKLVPRSAIFVEAFMPEYFVMENVKELLQGRHKHHFQTLHRHLIRLGYDVRAEVHDLASFGLPQHRTRALLIAKKRGKAPLRLRKSNVIKTVRDAISHLPPLSAGETYPFDEMHVCPNSNQHSIERMRAIPPDGGSWMDIPEELSHLRIPSMNVEKPGSFPDIYGRLAWDVAAPTVTRECGHPGNGRYTHPEVAPVFWTGCEERVLGLGKASFRGAGHD
jgi:DNA (cytosine-5)-methyltransferase 1